MIRADDRIANLYRRLLGRRGATTAPRHCNHGARGMADAQVGVCFCGCSGCSLAVARLHQAHEHVTGAPAALVCSPRTEGQR
jgi:hypothetical protein